MSYRMVLAMAVVTAAAVGSAQTNPAPQQGTPLKQATPAAPQNVPAQPPVQQGTPPPPTTSVQGLTPPIEPKTTVPKTPPSLDVPPPPGGGPPINKPLSAEEAAQIALKNLPAVGVAWGQYVEAKGALVTQAAALYPQLTATQTYLRTEVLKGQNGGSASRTLVANSTGFSGGVVLSQLIFDFNHTRDLVRQSAAEAKSAQHSYTKAQIDAVLQAKQAFYTFAQDQELVDVQQANVDSAQASLDLAQASLDAGLGAPADVINARTTLANDIQSLLQARVTATTARITLCLDMGIDPRTPVVPANSVEPPESSQDVNALVDLAIKQRPDMLAAIEAVKAAGYGISAARTSNAPSLGLQVGANNNGFHDPLNDESISGAVTVTWAFDDAGAAAGRVESAKGNAIVAKEQLQQTTLMVISDVSSAYISVKTAEQQEDVAKTEVENATKNVELAEGQYKAGVTPFVTVITAQAALVLAKSSQVNAISTLAQARAALVHAVGGS